MVPTSGRTLKRPARTAPPVRFVPSFKAAYRAHGAAPLPDDVEGAQMYEYVVSDRTPRNELVAMLHGLSSSGQLERASELLRHAMEMDVRTDERMVSIVLNRCADQGRMDLCSSMLQSMRQVDVPVGHLTYCILIKGHGRAGDVQLVRKTYAGMRKQRVDADLPTFNAMADAFARNGQLADAEATLVEMEAVGVRPSVRTYNTLLKGYARAGQLKRAFAVVRRMREQLGASAPNEVTYNTLIHACVLRGELSRARQILQWLSEGPRSRARPRPSVQAYTALMRGYVTPPKTRNANVTRAWRAQLVASGDPGGFDAATALLRQMVGAGVQPNSVTANTLLTAALDARNITAAKTIAAVLKHSATQSGDTSLAHATDCAMIVGLCRPVSALAAATGADLLGGGTASAVASDAAAAKATRSRVRVTEALRRFIDLCEAPSPGPGESAAGLRPSTRTCNALLSALVSLGEAKAAVRVLALMEGGAAAPPNAYSLCLAMIGLGQDGQLGRAKRLWARLRAQGWADTVVLNSWLQCCVRAGAMEQALQAFQQVKADAPTLKLDTITFGTLVHGLVHRVRTRAASSRALRLWGEMRQRGVAPDDGVVFDVMLACRRHLGVAEALRVRAELQQLGWPAARLRPHEEGIRALLPPLATIMADEAYWAELGVIAAPSLTSEVGELTFSQPRQCPLISAMNGGGGGDDVRERAEAGPGVDAAEAFREPLSSEEIFERHGWNSVDSGWSAF